MGSAEVPEASDRLKYLVARASQLQQDIEYQKRLAPLDLEEQNSFLLRQEQRRWQDALKTAEWEPAQSEEKQTVLKEFVVCNRLQKIMTEVTTLINQHAEGEARLIRAELAELQRAEGQAANQLQEVEQLQEAKQKLLSHTETGLQIAEPEKAEPNTVAPKAKGAKGAKGKGGGKGKGPPLPSIMPKAKPKAKCQAENKKKNNLVTLYWRALPANAEKMNAGSSALLKQCAEMLAAASGSPEITYPDQEQQLGAVYEQPEAPESEDLPDSMIEIYFQRREAAVQLDSGKSDKISILDEKQRRMLGILMSKYRMKNRDESDRQIVAIMKQSVLSCNYEVLREEGLCMLRKVIRDQAVTGNKIRDFVQTNGEAALKKLRDPWLHRLIHEVLKVPQVEERLECMLFQLAFEDGFAKCVADLEVLCKALQVLSAKKMELRQFFSMAHRFGTILNSNCLAPQAPHGFSLSSLDKLVQTKSTASPKHNMLHFILAMMPPGTASELFSDEDLKQLAKAKVMKSFTVYQDCTELTQGFQAIREICETGKYQNALTGEKVKMERRRMTKVSRDEVLDEEPIDANDTFHTAMKAFVEKYDRKVSDVEKGCYCSFIMYKEQALFLGDLSVCWPPPKEDQDEKVDLLAVMHKLAVQVRKHAADVEQDGLRDSLAATRGGG